MRSAASYTQPSQTKHSKQCALSRITYEATSRRKILVVQAKAQSRSSQSGQKVVVIGAGLAGLSCASVLENNGTDYLLVEAQPTVGGRVQTDVVDGFLLDRGFQIFLTSYERCQQLFNYDALNLQRFYAGADVYVDGQFHRVADPFRHAADALSLQSLFNPVGSVIDKVRVGIVRAQCVLKSAEELLTESETTSLEYLQRCGFSAAMIDRFFRPFLGGIFFDNSLTTTSRMTRYVLRQLALGDNCLPASGIGALSQQLAAGIPTSKMLLNSQVKSVSEQQSDGCRQVILSSGQELSADAVVVATTDEDMAKLVPGSSTGKEVVQSPVGTCCLYFKADTLPEQLGSEPILYLNGEGSGIVNNMCFPSRVAPTYAPPGKVLISVSTVGDKSELSDSELEAQVRFHLQKWFQKYSGWVDTWEHIRTYRIPYSQPGQAPPTNLEQEVDLGEGLFICGDATQTATFDGAIRSGERAASAVLNQLR